MEHSMRVELSPTQAGKLAKAIGRVYGPESACGPQWQTSTTCKWPVFLESFSTSFLRPLQTLLYLTSKFQVFVRFWTPGSTKQIWWLNNGDGFTESGEGWWDSPGWEVNKPMMPFSIRDTFTSCEPKRERWHCLLKGVDATCQHVQVVQRCDRGGQVAFGVI